MAAGVRHARVGLSDGTLPLAAMHTRPLHAPREMEREQPQTGRE